jgi:YfiH family protein
MIDIIQPEWDAPAGIHAFCTTRSGGVSEAPFDSFNLSSHVGDDAHRVAENRGLLRRHKSLPGEPCWINQTHGNRVVTLENEDNRDADAAVTRNVDTVAVIMTADCLPILLCNREGTEVAAIHAGWRGLQAGVIQSTLAEMKSPTATLMAWIGPGISQACFEVGDEVHEAFLGSTAGAISCFSEHGPGHWLCDLAGLAELILSQQAVAEIHRDRHCSYRDQDLFYSYRRQAVTGRMASLIWINS